MSEQESKPLYEKNIYMALLAQQCSRYKEMFKYFEELIKQREKEGKSKELTPQERELLAYGYITYINKQRHSLHICMAFETKEKKDVNFLLNLERENYKTTLTIYLNKLQCFELLKNDEDDFKLLQKEKQIASMKSNLFSIREEINDFITNLKYKYLH